MSQSVGFNWGFKPSTAENTSSAISTCKVTKPRVKRRFAGEEAASGGSRTYNNRPRAVAKRRTAVSGIQGQPLPLSRALELMDRTQLQSTLLELVKLHPEIQSTFMALQPPSRGLDQYVTLLRGKLEQVYANLPYSRLRDRLPDDTGEGLNDYTFVRVKSFLLEFLNCLVDCLLESIPPQVQNPLHSLKLLDTATGLLSQLPHFSTASNNYYKNVCYEQVAEIWSTVIRQATQDISFLGATSTVLDWLQILQKHNEKSQGKLQRPLSLLQTFQESLEPVQAPAGISQDQQQPSNLWNNIV